MFEIFLDVEEYVSAELSSNNRQTFEQKGITELAAM